MIGIMAKLQDRVALVTGASSGIGAATVRALAAAGFDTVAAARRVERCEELAAEVGGRAIGLDVTDDASVAALAEQLDRVDVVVHSAGGALGLDRVEDAEESKAQLIWAEDRWRMLEDPELMELACRLDAALARGRIPAVAGELVSEGGATRVVDGKAYAGRSPLDL